MKVTIVSTSGVQELNVDENSTTWGELRSVIEEQTNINVSANAFSDMGKAENNEPAILDDDSIELKGDVMLSATPVKIKAGIDETVLEDLEELSHSQLVSLAKEVRAELIAEGDQETAEIIGSRYMSIPNVELRSRLERVYDALSTEEITEDSDLEERVTRLEIILKERNPKNAERFDAYWQNRAEELGRL